ncbi:MAG: hypothetical protein M3P11_05160 [Actinomycetota bacterium]|nr:hypothetical protein [Actinomycetota bacterium]
MTNSVKQTVAWVLFVTDGTVIAYPPELYRNREKASLEAERWAWFLSGEGVLHIERPFEGRLIVGERDVRLIQVDWSAPSGAPWIGTYWTRDGYPDPEAVVLLGESEARGWVRETPQNGSRPSQLFRTPWFEAAVFPVRGEEEYAVAHLAKVIA